MVQGKEGGEVPTCMTKLAAALHKVVFRVLLRIRVAHRSCDTIVWGPAPALGDCLAFVRVGLAFFLSGGKLFLHGYDCPLLKTFRIAAVAGVVRKRTHHAVSSAVQRFQSTSSLVADTSLSRTREGTAAGRLYVVLQHRVNTFFLRALYDMTQVLVTGHIVTPYIFWSLVDASFLPEDHERASSQKMILVCLSFVHQRPDNYHRFLLDNGIKVPTSLKKAFQKAHNKRAQRNRGSKMPLLGGSSLARLAGVVEGGSDQHGGTPDDRRSSNMSITAGGFRYGGGGASTANLSDGGGSDDMSDTMSVFSVSTRLEGS